MLNILQMEFEQNLKVKRQNCYISKLANQFEFYHTMYYVYTYKFIY